MNGFMSRLDLAPSAAPEPLLAACGRCGLHRNCLSPKMPAAGMGKRRILLIGEAPGVEEDRRGEPFVGISRVGE